MKIPSNAVIPMEKITAYLLVPREWDDKSKFLDYAGFTKDNPTCCLQQSESLQPKSKPWKMERMSTESSSVLRAA